MPKKTSPAKKSGNKSGKIVKKWGLRKKMDVELTVVETIAKEAPKNIPMKTQEPSASSDILEKSILKDICVYVQVISRSSKWIEILEQQPNCVI